MPRHKFEKGNSVGGRKKGSINKSKKIVKDNLSSILENNMDRLQEDLDALEPKDRVKLILEIASYIIPKMKSVEVDVDVQHSNALGLSTEEFLEIEAETLKWNEYKGPKQLKK